MVHRPIRGELAEVRSNRMNADPEPVIENSDTTVEAPTEKSTNVIEVRDKDQPAKGQNSDWQVCSDAEDLETQVMGAIDSAYDFFRFLQVSTRGIANNQRRLFKDGYQHPATSGRRNQGHQSASDLPGRGDTEAGQLYL